MIGAVVIGLVLGSPFMLLFAALGPIVALATMLDARRSARRHRRVESARFERECALFETAIDEAHSAERLDAAERHPRIPRSRARDERPDLVRIGTAPAPSAVAADVVRPVGESDADLTLGRMLARARVNPELPALIARGPVVLMGRGLAADALARRLEREPGVVVQRGVAADPSSLGLPGPAHATVIRVLSATALDVHEPSAAPRRVRPEFMSGRQLETSLPSAEAVERLPDRLDWSALQKRVAGSTTVGGVPIGVDDAGPVSIDLVRSGPHALVGGTTGSGKSELLRALALGWAAAEPPGAAQLLFVDFKGGATFAGLTDLPHTVGLVTDLDPLVAQRALRSLRAELRRRERVLADAGVRDVRDRPELLARLLVLVDEFATLSSTFPDLHDVFADLAARGRSLGVHLVLCTQHPASIVRDTIAANCPVRLSFRVTEAASGGIVGALARELVAAPPGRAALVDEHGSRLLQVAVVEDDDIAQVRERWQGHSSAPTPWCAPLPERVGVDDVEAVDTARRSGPEEPSSLGPVTFGLLDDPDEQRRRRATWHPQRDGSLVILGASSSGRSTLLATLARRLPTSATALVVPAALPDAWAVLERVAATAPPAAMLLCDGLDALVARSGDRAGEVLARWDAAARAVRAGGGGAAATASAASSAGSLLSGRFESRVVLRCADPDEHAMAGGPRGLFDRSAPAGRGWWNGLQVQVAIDDGGLPDPVSVEVTPWQPDTDHDALVITSRVAAVAERIEAARLQHRVVLDLRQFDPASLDPERSVALHPRLLIAEPSEWQSAWSLLTEARRRLPVVLSHVDVSDVRALLGHRDPLPPIDVGAGEFWLAEPGRPPVRARWPVLRPAVD